MGKSFGRTNCEFLLLRTAFYGKIDGVCEEIGFWLIHLLSFDWPVSANIADWNNLIGFLFNTTLVAVYKRKTWFSTHFINTNLVYVLKIFFSFDFEIVLGCSYPFSFTKFRYRFALEYFWLNCWELCLSTMIVKLLLSSLLDPKLWSAGPKGQSSGQKIFGSNLVFPPWPRSKISPTPHLPLRCFWWGLGPEAATVIGPKGLGGL